MLDIDWDMFHDKKYLLHEEIYNWRKFLNVKLIVLAHIKSIVLLFTFPLQKKKHINDHVNVWITQAFASKEVEEN
jgi:hypothetical protein